MNVLSITNEARKATLASEAQAAQRLKSMHVHTRLLLSARLDAFTRKMEGAVKDDGTLPLSFTHKGALADIKTGIIAVVNQFASSARVVVGNEAHAAFIRGANLAQAQLKALTPKTVVWTYQHIITTQQSVNRAYKLFDNLGDETATHVVDTIRQGVIMGRGPVQIARAINDSLDWPLWRAMNISRTESMRSLRDATSANYRANSDVVDAWIWFASLGTACAACTAMHGTEHSLDEDMDSHNNCRCTQVPKTKSWQEILSQAGIDGSDIPETTVQVPLGTAWFAEQNASQQKTILSPAKYAAYQKGDLSLDDLVGRDKSQWGNNVYEKSLKQLGLDASDYLGD